ncbi:hypothetical protein [Methanogenium organophilum]|uniref:Uncharacterized protein n=1 Tax=Methanogenium organophilum TaxID=2199 RepID=A0A9X9S515_METOG|nr:hypothetical protein [Methanogenium organophilum]WAI01040.1 hypothetical protein OU421_11555 [Methanogenium organophilum]
MNEIARRIVMMIGIVAVGTILIFLNASIPITLVATLGFGVIMAIGLGLLKSEDLKQIPGLRGKNPNKPDNTKEIKINPSQKDPDQKEKKSLGFKKVFSRSKKDSDKKEAQPTLHKKEGGNRLSAGLSATLASFQSTIHKARDNKHAEKIDTLLNSAIKEPVVSSDNLSDSDPDAPSSDDPSDLSDEFDFFDDEDFESLDSLEIDGEDISLDLNADIPDESKISQDSDSDTLNIDDEIHSILLAENALDAEEDLLSESLLKNTEIEDISTEEEEFDSDIFFVQGIEDGLDEEPFIHIRETSPENQNTVTLNETLEELTNIPEFEKIDISDDEFSDFHSINLEELDTDDLSIETDDIIIEEEEEIGEAEVLPDDFITSSGGMSNQNEDFLTAENNNSLLGNSGSESSQINETISFSGKNEYDDILSVLKSDIKKTKKGPDPSLIREMKDVHVEAKDLADELETVLSVMGGKIRQQNGKNTRRGK